MRHAIIATALAAFIALAGCATPQVGKVPEPGQGVFGTKAPEPGQGVFGTKAPEPGQGVRRTYGVPYQEVYDAYVKGFSASALNHITKGNRVIVVRHGSNARYDFRFTPSVDGKSTEVEGTVSTTFWMSEEKKRDLTRTMMMAAEAFVPPEAPEPGQGVRRTYDVPYQEVYDAYVKASSLDPAHELTKGDRVLLVRHDAASLRYEFRFTSSVDGKSTEVEGTASHRMLGGKQRRKLVGVMMNYAEALVHRPRSPLVKGAFEGQASQLLMEKAMTRALKNVMDKGKGATGGGAKPPLASDVDRELPKGSPRPQDFALVIGIEKYRSLPAADYGERDAETVRAYLRGLGVPPEHIVLLAGERATRTDMANYLEDWLPRNATPQSRVYFYFSGHGAPDPSTGSAYLMPWNGDPAFLKSSAYPVKKVYESLQKLRAKEVVVMLDTCFSGAGGRSVIAKGMRPLVTVADSNLPAGSKLSVLTASSGSEITGSLEGQGHGMFTYYLLKGLQGAADADRDAHVTLQELHTYVRAEVRRAARLQNREQTPQLQAPAPGLRLY